METVNDCVWVLKRVLADGTATQNQITRLRILCRDLVSDYWPGCIHVEFDKNDNLQILHKDGRALLLDGTDKCLT